MATNYQFANIDEARAYRANLAARLERDCKSVASLRLALANLDLELARCAPEGGYYAIAFALHAVISIQVAQFDQAIVATRAEIEQFDIALKRMESGLVIPGMNVGRKQ